MSRTRISGGSTGLPHIEAPCEVTLRTLPHPTKLSGRLLRVIAQVYNIQSPQLLQLFI